MKDNTLPKHIAAQIDEHTSAGYLLFRISDDGKIIHDSSFDSEMAFWALLSKAKLLIEAFQEMSKEAVMDGMYNIDESEFEIDEDDYE